MSIGRFEGDQQLDEVVNEIMITRGITPEAPGAVHWSIAPLVESDTLQHVLKNQPYAKNALVPAMRHLSTKIPTKPLIEFTELDDGSINIALQDKNKTDISAWVVYSKYDDNWSNNILSRTNLNTIIPLTRTVSYTDLGDIEAPKVEVLNEIQVTYIDRFGNESEPLIYTCFNSEIIE